MSFIAMDNFGHVSFVVGSDVYIQWGGMLDQMSCVFILHDAGLDQMIFGFKCGLCFIYVASHLSLAVHCSFHKPRYTSVQYDYRSLDVSVKLVDCPVMPPPFSMKYNDLQEQFSYNELSILAQLKICSCITGSFISMTQISYLGLLCLTKKTLTEGSN